MDNFKTIYRILKYFESAMDFDHIDEDAISHQRLNITYERWEQLLIMLQENGYIEGVAYLDSFSDGRQLIISSSRITLRGLEYLSENSLMQKASNLLKGITDTLPGL